ncbi:MAG: toprim domain-containing protein, partial [Thermoproteota archaeon]
MRAVFESLCPLCRGSISDDLLQEGSACRICLENNMKGSEDTRANPYPAIRSYCSEVEDFKKSFSYLFGKEPTSIQMVWAKRHILGESLHIIAPYRSGKTTFGMAMSIFVSNIRGKSSFIIAGEAELSRLREILHECMKRGRLLPEQLARLHLVDISRFEEFKMEEKPDFIFVDEPSLLKPKIGGILKRAIGPETLVIAVDSYAPVRTSLALGGNRLNRIKVYSPLRRIKDFYISSGDDLHDALVEVIETVGSKGILAIFRDIKVQESLITFLSSKGFHLQPLTRGDGFVTLYVAENKNELLSLSNPYQISAKYVLFVGVPLTQHDEKGKKLPDIRKYLEISSLASGFGSECYHTGLSIVLVDDDSIFAKLEESLRRDCGISVNPWNREVVLTLLDNESSKNNEASGNIQQVLVIVESPTKARTISSFFNGTYNRRSDGVYKNTAFGDNFFLEVIATGGHVTDLSLTEGFHGVLITNVEGHLPVYSFIRRCKRCGNQFNSLTRCPSCGSSDFIDKGDVVSVIRQTALISDRVLIATDPDAEGEKIAWDLYVMLKPFNRNIMRAEFYEVTRYAFEEAIRSPRDISLNLVDAQISRRIEDRWIGFELSRRLWKHFSKKTLSAGRAQSPILNWIVNRTRENKEKITYALIALENGIQLRVSEKEVEDI